MVRSTEDVVDIGKLGVVGVGSSVPPRVSLGSIFGDILSHKATETTLSLPIQTDKTTNKR